MHQQWQQRCWPRQSGAAIHATAGPGLLSLEQWRQCWGLASPRQPRWVHACIEKHCTLPCASKSQLLVQTNVHHHVHTTAELAHSIPQHMSCWQMHLMCQAHDLTTLDSRHVCSRALATCHDSHCHAACAGTASCMGAAIHHHIHLQKYCRMLRRVSDHSTVLTSGYCILHCPSDASGEQCPVRQRSAAQFDAV